MKADIWHWWQLLPTALVLYLGSASFVERYPTTAPKTLNRYSNQSGPDSLLAFLDRVHRSKSLKHSVTSILKDSGASVSPNRVSPFRPVHAPSLSANHAPVGPKADPPWRKFVLKGMVGNTVATITDRLGKKVIVKVGENVDSATVISIEPNKVVLKDRAGKFDLLQEP